jgi:hypothetical protein
LKSNATETEKEWKLIAKEKKELIPEMLQKEKRNVVLNGYEREVEVVIPPCRKLTYLYLFCRSDGRKREKGESHSNRYEFHPKGMKTTR